MEVLDVPNLDTNRGKEENGGKVIGWRNSFTFYAKNILSTLERFGSKTHQSSLPFIQIIITFL